MHVNFDDGYIYGICKTQYIDINKKNFKGKALSASGEAQDMCLL